MNNEKRNLKMVVQVIDEDTGETLRSVVTASINVAEEQFYRQAAFVSANKKPEDEVEF